jgi:thymidylate synthase (FAD)
VAKEQARAVLPEGLTNTTLYMSGTLRSWIHYCQLRMSNGTQKEHQEIAEKCWDIVGTHFPNVKQACED